MKPVSTAVFSVVFSAIALVAFADSARAVSEWTHTASACAVDEGSLDKYRFSGPDLSYGLLETSETIGISVPSPFPNQEGQGFVVSFPLIARCNLMNPKDEGDPSWDTLIVGYQDPDGTGTTHSVRASLIRVSRPHGDTSTVVSFDSNLVGEETERREHEEDFSHAFDFKNNEYYIRLELIRENTEQNPVVYKVRLTSDLI